LSLTSNGIAECADCSDEPLQCEEKAVYCDGKSECDNSEDEKNCQDKYFICANGKKSIKYTQRCDGTDDCGDGSDESTADCKKGKCANTANTCNGIVECPTKEDETSCKDADFQCDNKAKVKYSTICDGKKDCTDGSDENSKVCGHIFLCKNSQKIFYEKDGCSVRNDGFKDCADGSDEDGTGVSTTKRHDCKDGHKIYFSSKDSKLSLTSNGIAECADCSDEPPSCEEKATYCDGTTECEKNEDEGSCKDKFFICVDGSKNIKYSMRCNGKKDCADGSDENKCKATPITAVNICTTKKVQVNLAKGACLDISAKKGVGNENKSCLSKFNVPEEMEFKCEKMILDSFANFGVIKHGNDLKRLTCYAEKCNYCPWSMSVQGIIEYELRGLQDNSDISCKICRKA